MSVSHVRSVPSLLEALEGLTDPRKRRGDRHRLAAVLAVVATLGGARNYREMESAAEDFSQDLLTMLGARLNRSRGGGPPPLPAPSAGFCSRWTPTRWAASSATG